MSNNNGAKGKVCRYCMWVWDHEGERYAQAHDTASWVNDGYKLVVCESCLSKRACERHALMKKCKLIPSKELIEREYRELRGIIRQGTEPRRANAFDSYGKL